MREMHGLRRTSPLPQIPVVRTADPAWLESALKLYAAKQAFELVDDGGLGLEMEDVVSAVALIAAARRRKVPWKTIVGALTGVGLCAVGIYMVGLAIADPEPTSKLGLLVVGGCVTVLTGGVGALYALGVRFTVRARARGGSFEISPE